MTLLQQRDEARYQHRLELCAATRTSLRQALTELMLGREVVLFGSITRPGRFHDRSDVDLAIPGASAGAELLHLTAELMERLGRPVDIVALDRCRFREKILREGERWTA